ncbi:TetR/AcrR family transcriptional regulator [Rhodococcoides fascians]|uniref:TetR/AcrR family transcriptional regulator n=1 Tax=Rhodococcoides fascians TaxID=1828 RepID=UPI000A6C2E34|nr:TetR/AcrR family transcriptional regulator [Rhodococcus fascians]
MQNPRSTPRKQRATASALVESAHSEIGTSKAAARFRTVAAEVFASKGYGAATTREIAAHLDLSPGALYPHYRTKESLLYAITLEGHAKSLASVDGADDPAQPAATRLANTMVAYTEWHARHHALARVVQYELHALSRPHFRTIASLRSATTSVIDVIIEDGCASGDFGTDDPDAASLAISSLAVDVSRWFPSRLHSDPRALGKMYGKLALELVRAPTIIETP